MVIRLIFCIFVCIFSPALIYAEDGGTDTNARSGRSSVFDQNFYRSPTGGIITPKPVWSAGVVVGHSIGLTAQKVGVFSNTVDLALGFNSLHFAADYIFTFDQYFNLITFNDAYGINHARDKILIGSGGGIEIGDGLALRIPVKIEYILPRDPFGFFLGFVLLGGPFGNPKHDARLTIDWMLGVRVLL